MASTIPVSKNGFSEAAVADFISAIHDRSRVTGLTHDFYNYPARFSPLFARAAIELFTEPGNLVLDPFMGGGTTLVECRALGRQGLGVDISSLATFISRVKTALYSNAELDRIQQWFQITVPALNPHKSTERPVGWIELGYQKNLSSNDIWPIRNCIEQALNLLPELCPTKLENFARLILLKTGQWALDCKKDTPSVKKFRTKLLLNTQDMISGALEYRRQARKGDKTYQPFNNKRITCLNRSVIGLEDEIKLKGYPPPKLILTSPPYPGAHVLYHRWQIRSRKETPAPFWIGNVLDGTGPSHYTMGSRFEEGLKTYFKQITNAFGSLHQICDVGSMLVQMLAFPHPEWQLEKYLRCMNQSGFSEILPVDIGLSKIKGRIWRDVPSRKWYVTQSYPTCTSREVVLFHIPH